MFGQLTYHSKEKCWTYTPIKDLTHEIAAQPYKIQGREGYYLAWLGSKNLQDSKDLGELIQYIQENAW